jgi:pilus assembly protein Flp/PilA
MLTRLYVQLSALRREERGATAVEYGMLVALIAAVIVVVVALLGTQVDTAFEKISDALPGGD